VGCFASKSSLEGLLLHLADISYQVVWKWAIRKWNQPPLLAIQSWSCNPPVYPVPRTLAAFFTSRVLTHRMAPKRP
jgi:hypothetical protein